MNALRFAVKRLFTTPWFTLFALLILLVPVLAQRAAAEVAVPAPGYAVEGAADEDARRMAAYLEEAGFTRHVSREELAEAVASGKADAGVVIPGNISEKLRAGRTEGCLGFIRSANAFLPDLWQEHASAALFGAYAPYVMADALEGTGLSEEEIFAAYYGSFDNGKLFSFDIESAKGRVEPLSERQDRFFLGALSILLFAAAFYAAAEPLANETRKLSARSGMKKAVLRLYLPGAAARYLLLWLAGAGAALLCERPAIILPLAAYVLLLAVFGLCLKLLPGAVWQGMLCLFLLLAALALCPIYNDLSLAFPAAAVIRRFLPPYWLWMLAA